MLLLRTAHAWAGAVLSFLIAVLGLSGALLVFRKDYLRLVFPQAREGVSLAPETLGPVIGRIDAEHTSQGLQYISLAGPDFGLHKAVFKDGGGAYLDAQGNTLARWAKNGRPEDWLFDLHHYLLAGDTGKLIAGVAGGAAILLCLTGLIIVWPSLRMFAWRVWPKTAMRRDLLAQHRDLGVIFALPILLIVFTGFSMVYSGPVRATLNVLTASRPAPPPERPLAGAGTTDWTQVLTVAAERFPGAIPRLASPPRSEGAPASLRLRQPAEWHQNGRTYVFMDPATNLPTGTSDGMSATRADRIFNALYPLHSAGIGGRLYDLLSLFTGLALTILGLAGTWTFLRKPRRKKRKRAVTAA
ncbi:PepSY-associated TM helix domain protein [Hyphomonas neptunium ATCC 15444]|uniref:PepSY-associated TM helix domain protein n=2 Tax=Hyphomonas TaxID=85 RepID=Q0C3C1_HYPNA|nr:MULTISPECIES: PepSY-associated TM helix domain-containing protein [Hyphomonas]ABI76754.1 PepSY-associated TM helix domain protein [Hyphomonas neptunium ATCC 15444]KCZ96019.1 PepSY-associated TM helix domain-containing protein [Hyphomonas hirschiana VP5]